MVQGNSARRKELAAGRRQDRKDEIERKKGGAARVTPVEARARLLDFGAKNNTKSSIIAWYVDPSVEKAPAWCAVHFRDGACPRGKRCKLSHQDSIAHLAACPLAAFAESLPALVRGQLEDVQAGGQLVYNSKIRTQRREKSTLYFVEYNNALVFDFENPHCFEEWALGIALEKNPEEENGDNDAGFETDTAGADAVAPSSPSKPAPLSKKERRKIKKESRKIHPSDSTEKKNKNEFFSSHSLLTLAPTLNNHLRH